MKKVYGILRGHLAKESGFTLIEMMIVLVVVSILLLIAVPNLSKNEAMAKKVGCEATIELVRAQKIAYEIEEGKKLTSLDVLVQEGYVDTLLCPNGEAVTDTILDKFSQ